MSAKWINTKHTGWQIFHKSYSTIVLYSRDNQGWWAWSTKKSTLAHLQESFMATWWYWSGITSPNVSSEQSKTLWTIFYEIFKKIEFSTDWLTDWLTHSLTHSLMRLVKRSEKLATASLLWRKCLEFCGEKTFHNIKCLLYALVSYSF